LRNFYERLHESISRNENLILGSMLLLLHLSMWWGFGTPIAASLLLAHLGLFLLWQPIWRRDQRFETRDLLLFALLTGAFLYWLSWWLLFVWLALLIGLVAGRTYASRGARAAYLLTLVFLGSEMLIKCVSGAFDIASVDPATMELFRYGLLAVPVAVVFIPVRSERPGVDIFRATAASLMVALLALGAVLLMYHRGLDYPVALLMSLFTLAGFLLIISWLLTPRAGRGGFAQLWEQALLNIGTPFEDWLAALAALADQEQTAERFLSAACHELLRLPWVAGVVWQAGGERHWIGTETEHEISMATGELYICTCTERPVGPLLLLHCKLLMQLLAHFHLSKLREEALAQQAHLQAIYETGARVTHDIKNLLQGLQSVTAALAATQGKGPEAEARARKLLAQQLPRITGRLQGALAKLQAPGQGESRAIGARQWWQRVSRGEQAGELEFAAELGEDAPIPAELFDSVLENLVENARAKGAGGEQPRISVRLRSDGRQIALTVTDDGAPVPEGKARALGRQAIPSDYGLGIGLYQASRQAELHGYTLALTENAPGRVSFSLWRELGAGARSGLARESA